MSIMKRFENESFEEYKNRRSIDNKLIKMLLSGYLVWDSKTNKTYSKVKHGPLGTVEVQV